MISFGGHPGKQLRGHIRSSWKIHFILLPVNCGMSGFKIRIQLFKSLSGNTCEQPHLQRLAALEAML